MVESIDIPGHLLSRSAPLSVPAATRGSLQSWLVLLSLACAPAASAEQEACKQLTETAINAALGDPAGTYNLAVDFYTGKCVTRDYGRAAKLWEKADALGVLAAKNNLGYLFSQGLGVRKDPQRAYRLWTDAAKAGHSEAQLHLGSATFDGEGVTPDPVTGLAWVLVSELSSRSHSDEELGQAIAQSAAQEKQRMLRNHPALLSAARERAEQLRRGIPEAAKP